MGDLKTWLSNIRLPVYILVMVFGIASWIDINGVWVELPLLVNQLPESWGLPSYFVITTQVANIGPIIYVIANRCLGRVTQVPTIYIIIAVGAIATMLLAFLWQETTFVNGAMHSTALLTLVAFLALVDCTSSVAFLPYMARFKPHYMTAYYIGEGLSGLIPGIVSLIQGVGLEPTCHNATVGPNHTEYAVYPVYPDPVFPVRDFMIFLSIMICLSGVAFSLIHYLPYCKQEHLDPKNLYHVNEAFDNVTAKEQPPTEVYNRTDISRSPIQNVTGSKAELVHAKEIQITEKSGGSGDDEKEKFPRWKLVYVLILTGWACCLTNTVLTSIGSYASLPYGQMSYTLAVRLGALANPLACLIALFLPTRSMVGISIHTLLGTLAMVYQLYLASVSPCPPLKHTDAGIALNVSTLIPPPPPRHTQAHFNLPQPGKERQTQN